MEAKSIFGLAKFFWSEDYLDKLIAGFFHCQPPELYRRSNREGVSDLHESCSFAWREERGDSPINVLINGHQIEGMRALTVHVEKPAESWLSCWALLRCPADKIELESLKADIGRMKQEFGPHVAFIHAEKIQPFLLMLKQYSPHSMWAEIVSYSDNYLDWTSKCKSSLYTYQREYRIGIGDCSVTELNSISFTCPNGLGDFIYKNPDLKIQDLDTGHVYFDLMAI